MKLKTILFLGTLAAFSAAHADDNYVVGSLGQSKFSGDGTNQGNLDATLNNSGGIVTSSNLKDTDTGFKLLLGRQFSPNFALEGGYVDLGRAQYNAALSDGGLTANYKSSGGVVDAVGIVPLSPDFSLFGKAGLYYGKTSVDSTNTSAMAASALSPLGGSWKTSLNYGVGLSYALNKTFSLRGEYERFSNVGDNVSTGGKSNVDLLTVGLQAKF